MNPIRYLWLTAAFVVVSPVLAQGMVSAEPAGAAQTAGDAEVEFAADSLDYNNDANIVTATGDVRMTRAGYKLRAGKVTWNRTTGDVTASNQISITNPSGDVAYGDSIALTDTLKDGAVENMLVVMADGGRLAADHGRGKGGAYDLGRATYSPCAVLDDSNCPKRPAWLITAKRVDYNPKSKRVRYHDARIEVFGVPILPIPYFWHTTTDQPATGLLTPQIEYTARNGLEVRVPFHVHLSERRDLTLTPFFFSAETPALQAEYRQLTKSGAFNVNAFVTSSTYFPISQANGVAKNALRGYFEAAGRFQLSPEWNLHGQVRVATDRTVLTNYELSTDDRLRNNLTIERIGPTSYFALTGWAVETLRPLERQGLTPVALPEIDYRKRINEGPLGGKIDLQLNSLAIGRTAGQNTQRAFAGAEWNLRKLTTYGQEVILTAYARGDVYHSNNNALTTTTAYQGQAGWQTRGIAALAGEVRWPLIGKIFGGTQRLTPRLQVVFSPPTANLAIPNEDARAIELDDSNLFALNRFPGYDRWEDGTRITYGADWALDRPGLSVQANVGQSYRFTSSPNIFPDGTGLTSQLSDVTGRETVRYRNLVSFTHRFRLDKDNLAIRRNEVDGSIGSTLNYFTLSYLKLNRHISAANEDLQDHEEVRVGGRIQVSRYWSLYGSTIVDLTTKKLNPQSVTDGYSPVRHRIGAAYSDDCLTLDLSWRRDFNTTIGAQAGSVYQFRIALRNLGR